MDGSSLLDPATEDHICNLVDNECPVPLSAHPLVVCFAYLAVFGPWGILSLFDFISDRWKKIGRIRWEGYLQCIFAPPTIGYTLYYVYLQAANREYTEMSAAIVATFFSIFHYSRTFWGLLQLHYFTRWVKGALNYMNERGFPLEHHEKLRELKEPWSPKLTIPLPWRRRKEPESLRGELYVDRLVETMLINNSIIDNEFFESDAVCFLNKRRLRCPWRKTEPWLRPKHPEDCSIRWMVPFLAHFGMAFLAQSRSILCTSNSSSNDEDLAANLCMQATMIGATYTQEDSQGIDTNSRPSEDGSQSDTVLYIDWSDEWSKIFFCRSEALGMALKDGRHMPYCVQDQFRLGCDRYQSRIRWLRDNLAPELFEGLPDSEFQLFQTVCASDLENFIIFLHWQSLGNDDRAKDTPMNSHGNGQNSNRRSFPAQVRSIFSRLCGFVGSCNVNVQAVANLKSRVLAVVGKVYQKFKAKVHKRDRSAPSSQADSHIPGSVGSSAHIPQDAIIPVGSNDEAENKSLSNTPSRQDSAFHVASSARQVPKESILLKYISKRLVGDFPLPPPAKQTLLKQLGLKSMTPIQSGLALKCSNTTCSLWNVTNLTPLNAHLDNLYAITCGFESSMIWLPDMELDNSLTLEAQFNEDFPEMAVPIPREVSCSETSSSGVSHSEVSHSETSEGEMNRSSVIRRANKWIEQQVIDLGEEYRGKGPAKLKFSGCIMETVRQHLALWSYRQSTQSVPSSNWDAIIPARFIKFDISAELQEATQLAANSTRAKKDMAMRLQLFDADHFVSTESLQSRILWECQAHLQKLVAESSNDDGSGPKALPLMMLCMLGYPCLETDFIQWYDGPELEVTPVCWPQTFTVDIQLVDECQSIEMRVLGSGMPEWESYLKEGDNDNVVEERVTELGGSSESEANNRATFRWQDWRDAFTVWVQGKSEDEEDTHMASALSRSTSSPYYDGNQRPSAVLKWSGWPPHDKDVDMSSVMFGDVSSGLKRERRKRGRKPQRTGSGKTVTFQLPVAVSIEVSASVSSQEED